MTNENHFFKRRGYLALLLLLLFNLNIQAQECSYFGQNLVGDATPATCDGTTTGNLTILNGQYATVSVTCGYLYTFSLCGSSEDTQMDLWTPGGGTFLASDDDGCSFLGPSTITWEATYSGVVEVHVFSFDSFLGVPTTSCTTDLEDSAPLVVTCNGLVSTPVSCGAPVNNIYCYDNDIIAYALYESTNGTTPLTLTFNAGGIEAQYDEIRIYDGTCAASPLLYSGDNGGDLTGITATSTGPAIYMELESDVSNSCVSGEVTPPLDWDVACVIQCDLPVGTASYDCLANELTVTISNAGGPNGGPYQLTVGGATPQTITGAGDYVFAGLPANQTYTVTADDGAGCNGEVTSIFADCPCVEPSGTASYDCYTNELTVTISDAGGPNGGAYELSVTGGASTQTIMGTGDYTFTGLTPNIDYTVTATNVGGCTTTIATLFADCACLTPEGTATYDCTSDFISLNINNPGLPTGAYTASVDGGTPVTINSTGVYPSSSFSGLTPDQTYNLVFDDGAGCTEAINYIYGDCRVPGAQCTDIILNGGLEGPGWNESAIDGNTPGVNVLSNPIIATQFSLEGTRSALLGNYGGSGLGAGPPYTSTIGKNILTTANTLVTLYVWGYWDICDNANDRMEVLVDGNIAGTFNAAGAFCGDDKWHEYSVDMSAYASGSSVLIEFRMIETGSGPSRFFIDDILIEQCPPAITCPASYPTLAGSPLPGSMQEAGPNMYDYETDGQIFSIQTIQSGMTVDYDAGTEITLGGSGLPFEVQQGAVFCAFIDGCDGDGGVVNPVSENSATAAFQQTNPSPTIRVFETSKADNSSRKVIQGIVVNKTNSPPGNSIEHNSNSPTVKRHSGMLKKPKK